MNDPTAFASGVSGTFVTILISSFHKPSDMHQRIDWLDHQAQNKENHKDKAHESGDPIRGVSCMTKDQSHILMPGTAIHKADRDDQRHVIEQVSW
jgi:hypothetical protein